MKIVITGALGHIGSELIQQLPKKLNDKVELHLIDNMSTQRYCTLFNLPESYQYKFWEQDLVKDDLSEVFAGADYVIHLGAITNAAGSFDIKEKLES